MIESVKNELSAVGRLRTGKLIDSAGRYVSEHQDKEGRIMEEWLSK